MFVFFLIGCIGYLILTVLITLMLGLVLRSLYLNEVYRIKVFGISFFLSIITLLLAMSVLWNLISYEGIFLNYNIIADKLSNMFSFITLFTAFLCLLLIINHLYYKEIQLYEFYLLFIFSLIGIITMILSYDLMTMYLGIELQSLCFYILTSLKFYSNYSIEAGLKYFILGSLSSGILLFGCSLIYGSTGLTNFLDLSILFYNSNLETYNKNYYEFTLLGIIFLYCGIFFKIGVVPFHMWVSDIYEGTATIIAIFFALVPQIGSISILIRLNMIFINAYLDYLNFLYLSLALVSIIIGTFGAIFQVKLKRLLAYSSISNIGYLLTALSSVNIESIFIVIFYIISYNIITLGFWSLLLVLRNRSNNYELKSISELFLLFKSNKYLSYFLVIYLFSSMGIPPLLGFFNKLFILLNLMQFNMYLYVFIIVLLSCISVLYNLRLIKVMYFDFKIHYYETIFLRDLTEIEAIFLILSVYINIFFFLYSSEIIMFLHIIILDLFI